MTRVPPRPPDGPTGLVRAPAPGTRPAPGRCGSALRAAVTALAAALVLAACAEPPAPSTTTRSPSPSTGAPTAARSAGTPALRVTTVAGGFDHAWDVAFLGGDRMLVTQRSGAISLVTGTGPGARVTPVAADLRDVYVRGEGGLMGIAAAPDAQTTGEFVTCAAATQDGRPSEVRLVSWRLSADGASAQRVRDPLVGGLPLNPSGRHSGCRPTFAPDGALLVGTGDTARATIPQDRGSLGGKVLRVDPDTGGPAPGNPFAGSGSASERLLMTYGHRNVQGVAIQPGTGRAWAVEHGPDVDDEINVLVRGANYGWDPAQGGESPGGYDESVPMTDTRRYPDARPAAWTSGDDTEAISGGDFLAGPAWGDLAGTLAVSAQAGRKMLLLRPGTGTDAERVVSVVVPAELDGEFGRLRGSRLGPDGALYVTTDNGEDDVLLRVERA